MNGVCSTTRLNFQQTLRDGANRILAVSFRVLRFSPVRAVEQYVDIGKALGWEYAVCTCFQKYQNERAAKGGEIVSDIHSGALLLSNCDILQYAVGKDAQEASFLRLCVNGVKNLSTRTRDLSSCQ